MPKYIVVQDWSGYSRGTTTYLVEAESKPEAIDNVEYDDEDTYEGVSVTIRDDREGGDWSAREVEL
jgi:hypothetical protein